MDWTDRGAPACCFGDGRGRADPRGQDGAGTAADRGVLATDLNSDGRFKDLLYVDGGVSTTGTSGMLRMEGREVFRHAVEKLAETAEAALHKAGAQAEQVDWIVPHQANLRIIARIRAEDGHRHGPGRGDGAGSRHTSAASIPLALSVGVARGQIKRGDLLVCEAIGGRPGWGAVVMRW